MTKANSATATTRNLHNRSHPQSEPGARHFPEARKHAHAHRNGSAWNAFRQGSRAVAVVTLISARSMAADPSANAGTGGKQIVAETPKANDNKKAEAASRFDRALKLFEAGDNAGALAEFKHTYEVFPDPIVLYNMGLVYAAMSRPVDAVDALEPLVKGNLLPATHMDRAKQALADQLARIGRLTVTTTPPDARIEIDGIEVVPVVGGSAMRVSEGKHIVGAVAEGYAPARKELFIAGNADATVSLDLVRTQVKQPANVTIRTRLSGTEIYVDGVLSGKSPLPTSVSVPAGHHVVELRRPGYVTARQEVDLAPGATGEIALDLAVDDTTLVHEGATLVIESSEAPFDIVIDGVRSGAYSGPLRLPPGDHHVSILAAGYLPYERDVMLSHTQTNLVAASLEPTPETRKAYRSSANAHRTWGIIGLIGGAVVAGSGVAVAVVGNSHKKDAQSALNSINSKYDQNKAPCDWKSAYGSENGSDTLCKSTIANAQSDLDHAKTIRTIGFVGVGVGTAVIATGLAVLLTGNDPNKYERRASQSRLMVTTGPGQFGTGLLLSF